MRHHNQTLACKALMGVLTQPTSRAAKAARKKNSPPPKLTDGEVRELRRLHEEKGLTAPFLAETFDISTNYVYLILRGEARPNA